MGVIQREIERAGVATVSISLVKEFTQVVRPPRALWVPFPFGRPLGAPKNTSVQRRVIEAAFALLKRGQGPVLEEFVLGPEEQQLDARNQTMGRRCGPNGCSLDDMLAGGAESENAEQSSVIGPYDFDLERVLDEVGHLKENHERYRAENGGRTQVGTSGVSPNTIARAVQLVHAFVNGDTVKVPPKFGESLALYVRLSIDDLKAYYMEAKTQSSADGTVDAAEANDWFWLDTRAGRLIAAARDRLVEATDREKDPNWILARSIVPRGYGRSGYTMTHVTDHKE